MRYRREIDGLRTIAVLPVILGHASIPFFSGGFIGVDVFFVISGFLITTIIMNDLDAGKFSILKFYERRARRILPALFLVLLAITPFAYFWIMPDEFKNYGQSLVATALSANNILLALTSGYWEQASIFKPLLHTWSLGVEEQYYVFFPLILLAVWKFGRRFAMPVMMVMFVASFVLASWAAIHSPTFAFYLLPTRSWELLAGAMTAHWLNYRKAAPASAMLHQVASLSGLVMILASVVLFDSSFHSPGPWILVPVLGSVLVIAFAFEGTLVRRLLGMPVMVGIGLISYSLYLWHQPLFVMARVHAVDPVTPGVYAALIAAAFVLAYLTWRFVEAPFRDRKRIGARAILVFSLAGTACVIAGGLYLNYTYGMMWRVFDKSIRIADMDKRAYNTRVFKYKTDTFANGNRRKIFVVGNSFGRDFVNMTIEAFDARNINIAYSDTARVCIETNTPSLQKNLFEAADIIVFAYDSNVFGGCGAGNIAWAKAHGKALFYAGTKDFGYNLNWILQEPPAKRADLYNKVSPETMAVQIDELKTVPPDHFISLLGPVMKNGMVPITDDLGRMTSTDRRHVTKYGAILFGESALKPSAYGALLMTGSNP